MMSSLLANLLLVLLCVQAAFAEPSSNAAVELENIENLNKEQLMEILRGYGPEDNGTMPTIIVEKMKTFTETLMASLTDLEKKHEDGEIKIKKPEECAEDEKDLQQILMTYDEDKNGKISPSEMKKIKKDYEEAITEVDDFIKKNGKDGKIDIKDFLAFLK